MKKVLLLSPYIDNRIERGMRDRGDQVHRHDGPVSADLVKKLGTELIVSYGYRRMISPEVIGLVRRAMNLHISLLPHNRGADPNLWSWVNRTRKGVSIHLIADELDAGNILSQEEIRFGDGETLETSYWKLRDAIEARFLRCWDALKQTEWQGAPQPPGGSVHRTPDREHIWKSLPLGWQTPVSLVEEIGDEIRQSAAFWSDAA